MFQLWPSPLGGFTSPAPAQTAPSRPTVSLHGGGATPEYCPPNADCVALGFLLTRTGPALDQPLTVRIFFGGTAAYGVDYEALPNTVTFAAGQDRVSLLSRTIDDTAHEGDETVQARLQLWYTSAANQCFRIEAARDFKLWTPVCTVPVIEGAAHYVDPDANTTPQKFYRLGVGVIATGTVGRRAGFRLKVMHHPELRLGDEGFPAHSQERVRRPIHSSCGSLTGVLRTH